MRQNVSDLGDKIDQYDKKKTINVTDKNNGSDTNHQFKK